jgi:hypothetical protein
LTLADIRAGLEDVAQQAQTTFGRLDARQLNWRADATQWSIAQCFGRGSSSDRWLDEREEVHHGGSASWTACWSLHLPGADSQRSQQAPIAYRQRRIGAAATVAEPFEAVLLDLALFPAERTRSDGRLMPVTCRLAHGYHHH